MKDGICPKCGSSEVVSNLRVSGGQAYPPYVELLEPEPEKRPFVWSPKSIQSHYYMRVERKDTLLANPLILTFHFVL